MNASGKYAAGDGLTGSGAGTTGSNAITSATGYTYSPSSTFQMAGNEQIQGKFETCQFEMLANVTSPLIITDRNQYKFMYVAMNPNNEKYQLEHEEARQREE